MNYNNVLYIDLSSVLLFDWLDVHLIFLFITPPRYSLDSGQVQIMRTVETDTKSLHQMCQSRQK